MEEPVVEIESSREDAQLVHECLECEDCSIYKNKIVRAEIAIIECIGKATEYIDILEKILDALE